LTAVEFVLATSATPRVIGYYVSPDGANMWA
jgi:hypothetical protein